MAVLGFIAVSAFLRAVLPFPEIGVVAGQLRFLEKHRAEFDTIFIGSSLTHHQISPAVFDRVMAESGRPTRSFNFGVNGMLVAETSFVLDRILATKPTRLKWVFIELDELETRRFAGAEGSRRDVYWRDWKRTKLLVQKLFASEGDPHSMILEGEAPGFGGVQKRATPAELLWFHLVQFGKKTANVSRRIDLAWSLSHLGKAEKMPEDLGPDGDGYAPFHVDMPEARKLPYQYQMDRARPKQGTRFMSPATAQAYRQMADKVRKSGATPVFLGMPVISQVRLEFRPEARVEGIVMSFNDENTYPDLYRIEMHAEEIHLNHRGAEKFSTLIAQRLAQLIEERSAPLIPAPEADR